MRLRQFLDVIIIVITDDIVVTIFGFAVRLAVGLSVFGRFPVCDNFIIVIIATGFFREQFLAILDGDLIVVRVDLTERQKAMAIATKVDEGGLQ